MASSPSITISSPLLLHRLLLPSPSFLNPNPNPNPNPKHNTSTIHRHGRRSLLFLSAIFPFPLAISTADSLPDLSLSVTDRVFMDFSFCPSYFRSDRPIGFDLAACPDAEPIGRVIFGLYGKLVPQTVANFKAFCSSSGYRGTLIHKIFQGQFFVAGRQGRREKGEVRGSVDLARNSEIVDPKAFRMKHSRPGTLSLCLAQNDDDEGIKLSADYRNVEFLVTTGPGPCPELDGENVVFGTVLEGMDIVTTIANIPTYKPAERIRQFNNFAEFLGDERAQIARTTWDRPLRTVYISDCGELQVAKPSFSPSLP